jgi:hypothetical protein
LPRDREHDPLRAATRRAAPSVLGRWLTAGCRQAPCNAARCDAALCNATRCNGSDATGGSSIATNKPSAKATPDPFQLRRAATPLSAVALFGACRWFYGASVGRAGTPAAYDRHGVRCMRHAKLHVASCSPCAASCMERGTLDRCMFAGYPAACCASHYCMIARRMIARRIIA